MKLYLSYQYQWLQKEEYNLSCLKRSRVVFYSFIAEGS